MLTLRTIRMSIFSRPTVVIFSVRTPAPIVNILSADTNPRITNASPKTLISRALVNASIWSTPEKAAICDSVSPIPLKPIVVQLIKSAVQAKGIKRNTFIPRSCDRVGR